MITPRKNYAEGTIANECILNYLADADYSFSKVVVHAYLKSRLRSLQYMIPTDPNATMQCAIIDLLGDGDYKDLNVWKIDWNQRTVRQLASGILYPQDALIIIVMHYNDRSSFSGLRTIKKRPNVNWVFIHV